MPADRTEREPLAMAPRAGSLSGLDIGVVDNGLWRSMKLTIAHLGDVFAARGARLQDSIPYDHLAPDFADQQHAVAGLATRVQAAVLGLGN